MATYTIVSGVCYIELSGSAAITVTGTADPTADIPYLCMGNAIYRIQGTPAVSTTCYFQSKDFDMSDQNPPFHNLFKTIDRVQLEYVDESASTPVSISLSKDGGATWTATTSRTIGTGDGRTKVADFWFLPVTGKFFRIKIGSTSSTKKITWTGAYIHYYTSGDYFEVNA